ncbi:MAG: hypothetical protein ACOY0T_39390 [Myxococcota bacterium]
MSVLSLTGIVDLRLGPLSIAFEPGLTCLVGDDLEALARLADILTGVRKPRRGVASLDGTALHSSPAARAGVASMLRDELLPPAPTLEQAVTLALSLRGVNTSARESLAALGLEAWLELACAELSAPELRTIALAIAVACSERAGALVLYDPLAGSCHVAPGFVIDLCRRLSLERSVVVLLGELAQAVRFGGRCVLLERGRISPFGALAATPPVALLIRSPEAPRFADVLRTLPAVTHVEVTGSELRVSGGDVNTISMEAVRLALAHEIALHGIELPAPSLAEQLRRRLQQEVA